jgi:hypothetical protein
MLATKFPWELFVFNFLSKNYVHMLFNPTLDSQELREPDVWIAE